MPLRCASGPAAASGNGDRSPAGEASRSNARVRRTGSISPAKMGGYRRPILEPHRDWLLEQVRNCPHVTLSGLQGLLAARGVTVSHDTVWRFLRGCGFSFKK